LPLQHAALLGGHIGLFLSMWLHARHVLYFTSDPVSPLKSRWRIPRPHFRLPAFGRNRSPKQEAQTADPPPARRKRPTSVSSLKSPTETASDRTQDHSPPMERTEAAGNPHFRIDGRHQSPSVDVDETAPDAISGIPRPRELARAAFTPTKDDTAAEHLAERDEPDENEGESEQVPSTPDLRGLSKKQRRRLMQEIRQRERAAGR
jgi:hypothetical protein